MKKLYAFSIALFAWMSIQAQDGVNKMYAKRPAIGVHFTFTDFNTANLIRNTSLNSVINNKQLTSPRKMAPGLAATYMQGFSNHVDVQARFAGTFLDLPVPGRVPFNTDNFFAEGDVSFLLKMLSDKYWVSPYLNVGVGASMYKGTHFGAFIPLGVGLQINFFDEAFLLVNSQYRVPVAANNNYHFFHSVGFAGNIGKPRMPEMKPVVIAPPKDTDGDGILDNSDACISVPGVAKYNGCPVPDSDNDGINDEADKCPTVAGEKRYDGCPVPDADKDGINDEDDKCPAVSGLARYNGCPVPDSDGDGINDEDDKCKDVPGVASQQGCPEISDAVIKKLDFAAKNILFESGSAKLKSSSFKGLNEVVKILEENPDVNISIDGHTDNTGTAEKNMVLSQSRADAVKSFLAGKGVAESRTTATGHGQEEPVADNKTTAGKAKNRRVELKLSY
jgi:outer membrane protein OmpA-like peptidoglycan-associated protein